MELKWLVVLLGAFALIHFTISEEEIPEVEGKLVSFYSLTLSINFHCASYYFRF